MIKISKVFFYALLPLFLVVLSANNSYAVAYCEHLSLGGGRVDCGIETQSGQRVYASDPSWCTQAGAYVANPQACTNSNGNLTGVIMNIFKVIIYVAGIIAILTLIYGGIKYITSAGAPQRIEFAKKTILYSIIGLVVVVLAFAIVNFVLSSVLSGT